MNIKFKGFCKYTTIAVVVALIAGLFLTNRPDTDVVLKAGYLSHPGYLPLFVAEDQKYFEQAGVNVELVRFESSPNMIAAFLADDLDIVPVATVSALSTESRDPGRFKVFAISSETKKNYLTSIVTMDPSVSNIKTIQDLRGKVVGVFPGPAARTLFSLVFAKYGLKAGQDFELRVIAPPLHVKALVSGSVHALATYEPYATQAVVNHNAVKLLPAAVETEVLSPTQGGSWLISSQTLKNNPDLARKSIDAINNGIDFIVSNRESAVKTISKYTSVNEEIAKLVPIVTYSKLGDVNTEAYQKHSDLMTDNAVISKKIDVTKLLLK